ncbi:MAG: SDR family oxidoreductase [Microbacterium sp.]
MDLGLEGRRALVVAGSKGLGAGVVRGLAREGAVVAFTSRDPRAPGVEVSDVAAGFEFDTDDVDAIDPLVSRVEAAIGGIDVLVLNAGGPASHDHPFDTTVREWHRAHRSLVISPFETIRRVVPAMAERGWGRVVVISSLAAIQPLERMPLSSAYRPSMIANVSLLARRYGVHGVTFNTVIPGGIRTGRSTEGRSPEDIDEIVAHLPVHRMGTPDEVGAVVAFLASQQAAFVTGAQVTVDGGYTLHGGSA